MDLYESQTPLLECLRDIWPEQKGLAALLFQNDLFRRLRRLELITEGGEADDAVGFLPEGYPDWDGGNEYNGLWTRLEAEAKVDVNEPIDALEDAVCSWVEDMIPEACAFFDAALDTGYLDEKWMHAAEMLRSLEQKPVDVSSTSVKEEKQENTDKITIEPIVVEAPRPKPEPEPVTIRKARPLTRRLRRIGRPLTPSFRRKIRQTRKK